MFEVPKPMTWGFPPIVHSRWTTWTQAATQITALLSVGPWGWEPAAQRDAPGCRGPCTSSAGAGNLTKPSEMELLLWSTFTYSRWYQPLEFLGRVVLSSLSRFWILLGNGSGRNFFYPFLHTKKAVCVHVCVFKEMHSFFQQDLQGLIRKCIRIKRK